MSTNPIDRLTTLEGCRTVDAGTVDAFLAENPSAVLFFTGDPRQRPESVDVAVVLRELLRLFPGQFGVGIVDRAAEADLKGRFRVVFEPTLLYLRDGRPAGTVARIQDWDVYLRQTQSFLAATQAA